jgi:Fe-S oxidoreductase
VILIERAARLRQRAFEIKMRQVDDTGASAVVTSCETCRMSFSMGANQANWQTPVESLVDLVAEHLAD